VPTDEEEWARYNYSEMRGKMNDIAGYHSCFLLPGMTFQGDRMAL